MNIYPYYIVQFRKEDVATNHRRLTENTFYTPSAAYKGMNEARAHDSYPRCYIVDRPGAQRRGLQPDEIQYMINESTSKKDPQDNIRLVED
jgi:hypothetical protein